MAKHTGPRGQSPAAIVVPVITALLAGATATLAVEWRVAIGLYGLAVVSALGALWLRHIEKAAPPDGGQSSGAPSQSAPWTEPRH